MSDDNEYNMKFEINRSDIEFAFDPTLPRRQKSTKHFNLYGVWTLSDEEGEEEPKDYKKSKGVQFVSGGLKDDLSRNIDSIEYNKDDENDELDEAFVRKNQFPGESRESSFAGLRFNQSDNQFGQWESHTRGIGAKLLQKMGYEPGKGLGRNLQGITAPIEAKKRPGFGAIGCYGPEHKHKPFNSNVENNDKNSDRIKTEKRWKKTQENVKRAKVVIQSADDIITQSLLNPSISDSYINKVKVIDMTGPEQKVLSGYHELQNRNIETLVKERNSFDLKNTMKDSQSNYELTDNIDLLIKMSENEMIENSKDLGRETERYNNLEEEQKRIMDVIEEERKQCQDLENILNKIENLGKKINENELKVEEMLSEYEEIKSLDPKEFEALKMHEMIVPSVSPLIRHKLIDWNPLLNPNYAIELFTNLKQITCYNDNGVYEALIWDIWMPIVRRHLIEWPSMKQCDEIISFLDIWKPLMPDWLFDNIVDQIVLPLIQKEVEEWNPLTDTVPIHSWLHPWLPLMADRSLEHIYDPIRHKLSNALTNWHPSDSSAQLILKPWKGVFSNGTFEAFLNINIAPKLEIAMQSLVINPHQQSLDVWHWVMAWQDLISTPVIASILEKSFFPRWLSVLFNWLSNRPDFDEVSKWYSGWKSMLSSQLQNHPSIKDALKRALEMMDHSVNSAMSMNSFNTFYPTQQTMPVNRQLTIDHSKLISNNTLSFKQLIEKKAEEHGILFMPIQNRFHEGKQVYKFGSNIIFIDRQVLFLFNNNNWVPTCLQALIDISS